MFPDSKPYSSYRTSGDEWLGDVPTHWEVRRLRTLVRIINGATPASGEPRYWDGQITWITPEDLGKLSGMYVGESGRQITSEGYDACGTTLVPSGSVALSIRAPIGHLGVLTSSACVNQGCRLLVPGNAVRSSFLYHALKNARGELASLGQGTTFSELPAGKLADLRMTLPPLPEQTAIVRFLDHADRRIRRYIRAKQKLIALLEEQKQAVIHQAVTGQIDVRTGEPYPSYKNSGVEWLGDVPEHWEISRVKTEFHCLNHRRIPLSGTERGEMSFRRYDYYGASGVIDKVDNYLFDDELLLIAEDGANLVLRNLPLAIIARGKFWVNNHAHILKPKRGHIEFLASVMESLSYLPWISGAAQPKLTQDRLMSIAIAVPSREEQNRIVSFSATETSHLRIGISRAEREINLLREYRTRLIADVVTGKLDVREAAAELPEVDPLAEDDLDGTIHNRENSNLGELNAEESAEEYTIEKEVTV